MDTTPWVALPPGASSGVPPVDLGEMRIGPLTCRWGERTYVMGIVNVTPDSFSGDGLMGASPRTAAPRGTAARATVGGVVAAAVALARSQVDEGADLIDVGGESTRPGHEPVGETEEQARVVPVVAAIRAALPHVAISIDTTKASVARAALDAGADLVNDVWGVGAEPDLLALVAERAVPIVVMHNRGEARYANVVTEVLADLEAALEAAERAGVRRDAVIVDPGIGFGKTPEQNLAVLGALPALRLLGRPVLLGTSRKSTIGRVLDLPPEERLEGTLATTALAVAAGVDVVRVHDVRANVRAARMADAIVRRGRG